MELAFRQKNDRNEYVDAEEPFDLGPDFDVLGPWTPQSRITNKQLAMLQRNADAAGGVKPLLEQLGLNEGVEVLTVIRAISRRNQAKANATMSTQDFSVEQMSLLGRYMDSVDPRNVKKTNSVLWSFIAKVFERDEDGDLVVRDNVKSLQVSNAIDAFRAFYRGQGHDPVMDSDGSTRTAPLATVTDDEDEPF